MQKLRLFQITNLETKHPIELLFFDNKQMAKAKRNEVNENANRIKFVVSPGPDHKNYKRQKLP